MIKLIYLAILLLKCKYFIQILLIFEFIYFTNVDTVKKFRDTHKIADIVINYEVDSLSFNFKQKLLQLRESQKPKHGRINEIAAEVRVIRLYKNSTMTVKYYLLMLGTPKKKRKDYCK